MYTVKVLIVLTHDSQIIWLLCVNTFTVYMAYLDMLFAASQASNLLLS